MKSEINVGKITGTNETNWSITILRMMFMSRGWKIPQFGAKGKQK